MFQYVVLGVRELTQNLKYLNFRYEKTTEMIHVTQCPTIVTIPKIEIKF